MATSSSMMGSMMSSSSLPVATAVLSDLENLAKEYPSFGDKFNVPSFLDLMERVSGPIRTHRQAEGSQPVADVVGNGAVRPNTAQFQPLRQDGADSSQNINLRCRELTPLPKGNQRRLDDSDESDDGDGILAKNLLACAKGVVTSAAVVSSPADNSVVMPVSEHDHFTLEGASMASPKLIRSTANGPLDKVPSGGPVLSIVDAAASASTGGPQNDVSKANTDPLHPQVGKLFRRGFLDFKHGTGFKGVSATKHSNNVGSIIPNLDEKDMVDTTQAAAEVVVDGQKDDGDVNSLPSCSVVAMPVINVDVTENPMMARLSSDKENLDPHPPVGPQVSSTKKRTTTSVGNRATRQGIHFKSFASALTGQHSNHNALQYSVERVTLGYTAPTLIDGVIEVQLPSDIADKGCARWANTVVGYFLGRRPYYPHVERHFRSVWPGLVEVRATSNGFFKFRFDSDRTMMTVIEGGPWILNGQPLFLEEWRQGMTLEKKTHTEVPTWVRFRHLPSEAWTPEGLGIIASAVGTPLFPDAFTTTMERIDYARVCVMKKLEEPYLDSFNLRLPKVNNVVKIKVEYEWKPPRCATCATLGHSTVACPSNDIRATKPASRKNGPSRMEQERRRHADTTKAVTKASFGSEKPMYESVQVGGTYNIAYGKKDAVQIGKSLQNRHSNPNGVGSSSKPHRSMGHPGDPATIGSCSNSFAALELLDDADNCSLEGPLSDPTCTVVIK